MERRLRGRSVARWHALPRVDDHRCLHAGRCCHRSWPELERRRCGSAAKPVAVLKQAELGACGGGDSQGWDQRANLLSMEEAIRWHGDRSGSAVRGTYRYQSRQEPRTELPLHRCAILTIQLAHKRSGRPTCTTSPNPTLHTANIFGT